MGQSSSTGEHLRRWARAQQGVDRARLNLRDAEAELSNAAAALGEHLTPDDAAADEQFSIWVNGECLGIPGDCMLSVTKKADQDFSIKWREKKATATKA